METNLHTSYICAHVTDASREKINLYTLKSEKGILANIEDPEKPQNAKLYLMLAIASREGDASFYLAFFLGHLTVIPVKVIRILFTDFKADPQPHMPRHCMLSMDQIRQTYICRMSPSYCSGTIICATTLLLQPERDRETERERE